MSDENKRPDKYKDALAEALSSPQRGSELRFDRTADYRSARSYDAPQQETPKPKEPEREPEPAPEPKRSAPFPLFRKKNAGRTEQPKEEPREIPVTRPTPPRSGGTRPAQPKAANPAPTYTAAPKQPSAPKQTKTSPVRPTGGRSADTQTKTTVDPYAPQKRTGAGQPKTAPAAEKPKPERRQAKKTNAKDKRVYLFGTARRIESAVFIAVMLFGFIFAARFWARPKTSVVENRDLAEFPKLTFSSLFNGSFFDGVTTWFSDTFPSRDSLISANATLKKFIGINGSIFKLEEGNAGDDIPDAPMTTLPAEESTEAAPVEKTTAAPETTTSAAMTTVKSDNMDTQALSSIFIAGNTAYEYYNFVESTANNYITAVNRMGAALKNKTGGKTKLYSVIVPTSIDITLDPAIRANVSSSDQRKSISYIENSLDASLVNKVDIFDTLKAHSGEYIYFRTDHHWTALGAYYGYNELMKAMGKTPRALGDYDETTYEGFLGSFWRDSGQSSALGKTPDSIVVYETPGLDTSFTITLDDGVSTIYWPLIANPDSYHDATLKYSCFAGADTPYAECVNKNLNDGSACIIVKESFGNVFSPFLAEHFQYLYLIDYRYWRGSSIADFAAEKNAEAVIFLNNISMTRNSSLVDKLAAVAQ